MAKVTKRHAHPGRRRKWFAGLDENQLVLVGRALAQLRLPFPNERGNPFQAESWMPTAEELVSRCEKLVRLIDSDQAYETADERKKWTEKKHYLQTNQRLFRGVKTWSERTWLQHRAQFLCEEGLDLDTAMLLRGQADALAVEAISQKAQLQIQNLCLLASSSSSTNRAAVDALLITVKHAVQLLNDLALEKKAPAALRAAQESETWPVLAADHPTHKKAVKAALKTLDVGSRYQRRIEGKARAILDDPAGILTALLIVRLTKWRDTYKHLRNDDWFWNKLPDWAKQIVDLPDYDKDTWLKWWKSGEALLEHTYGGQGRVTKEDLGRILKDKSGHPLSYRLAKMKVKGRFEGQAPA